MLTQAGEMFIYGGKDDSLRLRICVSGRHKTSSGRGAMGISDLVVAAIDRPESEGKKLGFT